MDMVVWRQIHNYGYGEDHLTLQQLTVDLEI